MAEKSVQLKDHCEAHKSFRSSCAECNKAKIALHAHKRERGESTKQHLATDFAVEKARNA